MTVQASTTASLRFLVLTDFASQYCGERHQLKNQTVFLSSEGTPFPVDHLDETGGLDNGYGRFFISVTGSDCTFELVRLSAGRHEGSVIVLRTHRAIGHIRLGVVTEQFTLASGMGATGHANLKAFLIFLKTECTGISMNAFDLKPDDPNFDFWSVFGQHHPRYFQQAGRRTSAPWLQQLFTDQDPDAWFKGREADLKEIQDTPFGGVEGVAA